MKIKTTVVFVYNITDEEIAKFKAKVLERVQDDLEDYSVTLDCISDKVVEDYLENALSEIIEESYLGYSNSGVIIDTYFETISLDYYEEDVCELVQELADQIIADIEEDYTPSAENGDYSPSNPWDAPGMKISDFI